MTLPAKFPESGGPPLSRAETAINALITHLEEREGEKCCDKVIGSSPNFRSSGDSYPIRCKNVEPCPCHQPKEEKSPQKEHLDHGMNAIADNLTLSSKLVYQPKEATDSWEEEFDSVFYDVPLSPAEPREIAAYNARLKTFIKELITREKAAQLQEVREKIKAKKFRGEFLHDGDIYTPEDINEILDDALAALEGVETAL